MSRTTIKDIANVLHINPSTVSRALKDHPDIGRALKDKIQAIAADLGFIPNQYASNLRSGKTFTIGLIVPDISMFFFPSVIKAAEELTHEMGYRLLILHSNDTLEAEADSARICARYGVDGVLVSLSRNTINLDHFKCLSDNAVPVVFYDKIPEHSNEYSISFQNEAAVGKAIGHLLNAGSRPHRFAGFFGDERLSLSNTRARLKGFKDCMHAYGYAPESFDIVFGETVQETADKFRHLYTSANRPDAVVAMGDDRLLGISKTINELGIRIPDDLGLIGLSDGFIPGTLPFKVPFVLTSGYHMGKAATRLLFDLIDHREASRNVAYIETPLMNI